MRKELLGAVVIFGLGTAGAVWAQETTDPANPVVIQPTTEAPAATDTSQSTTMTTEAPAADAAATTTAPAATDTEAVATTTQDGETVQEVAPDHLLGTDFMGADVVQADGTAVGEISDVVIDPETYVIKNVVIDVGGFLGIGTKTVTLPVEDLSGPNADGNLQVGMTREQIETLPDFVGMPEPDQVPTMADPAVTDTTTDTTTTQ